MTTETTGRGGSRLGPRKDERPHIQDPSLMSLRLETYCGDVPVSWASGFVVKDTDGSLHLVTNRHVVRNRHNETGKSMGSGAWPDRLVAHFPRPFEELGVTIASYDLRDDDGPIWRRHPDYGPAGSQKPGPAIDIAVVGIDALPDGADELIPYDLNDPNEPPMFVGPSSEVFVVGFPFGLTGTGKAQEQSPFAIWTRGTVASELAFAWDHLPMFLVDCRGRSAMSGSPVLVYSIDGSYVLAANGSFQPVHGPAPSSRLLGVYSGRVYGERDESSDLGIVWAVRAIQRAVRDGGRGNDGW